MHAIALRSEPGRINLTLHRPGNGKHVVIKLLAKISYIKPTQLT